MANVDEHFLRLHSFRLVLLLPFFAIPRLDRKAAYPTNFNWCERTRDNAREELARC